MKICRAQGVRAAFVRKRMLMQGSQSQWRHGERASPFSDPPCITDEQCLKHAKGKITHQKSKMEPGTKWTTHHRHGMSQTLNYHVKGKKICCGVKRGDEIFVACLDSFCLSCHTSTGFVGGRGPTRSVWQTVSTVATSPMDALAVC